MPRARSCFQHGVVDSFSSLDTGPMATVLVISSCSPLPGRQSEIRRCVRSGWREAEAVYPWQAGAESRFFAASAQVIRGSLYFPLGHSRPDTAKQPVKGLAGDAPPRQSSGLPRRDGPHAFSGGNISNSFPGSALQQSEISASCSSFRCPALVPPKSSCTVTG